MGKMTMVEAGRLGWLKSEEKHKKAKQERIAEWERNPRLCRGCEQPLTYENRSNAFCSQSCAASFNNRGVRRHGSDHVHDCEGCGQPTANPHYCGNVCQKAAEWRSKKLEIAANGMVLVGPSGHSTVAKRYVREVNGHQCSICQGTEWRGLPMPLILDHVDGNSGNWKLDNLRLVCGNCDMQLPTYKSKNIGNGRAWRRKRYAEGESY